MRAYTDPKVMGKYNPLNGGDPTKISFHGVCVERCPTQFDAVDSANGDFCFDSKTKKSTMSMYNASSGGVHGGSERMK